MVGDPLVKCIENVLRRIFGDLRCAEKPPENTDMKSQGFLRLKINVGIN